MSTSTRKKVSLATAAAVLVSGLLLDDGVLVMGGKLVSSAEARVGRPLTPMSYAGVARRTTRRAVYGTAAAAAAAGAYAVAPGCAQVTDAYGRIYTRC